MSLTNLPIDTVGNSRRRSHSSFFELLEPRQLLSSSPSGMSPQEVRHAYSFTQAYLVRKHVHFHADGAGQTIAIVDAYDNPNLPSDIRTFDRTFGLSDDWRPGKFFFRKAFPEGAVAADPDWGLEEALDVEWAHAIAPKARIVLVEAQSSSLNDLLTAVDFARNIPGVSTVSMSWGGKEFFYETAYDQYLTTPPGHIGGGGIPGGITFVAAAGDVGAPAGWPAVSPNVIAVGGTHLNIAGNGQYVSESAWSGSGGGVSHIEQTAAPDVAYDADPNSGFAVFDSQAGQANPGWQVVGGTSAGAPQWSALFAIADEGRALYRQPSLTTNETESGLFSVSADDFHDITTGSNGFDATVGYDLVTGRGTPFADRLIHDLVYVA